MSERKSELVLIGGGGHGRVLASVARRDGHPVVGYLDLKDRGELDGVPYLGSDDRAAELAAGRPLLLGIGLINNAAMRWDLVRRYLDSGTDLFTLVSSRAGVVPEACLGAGTVVLDMACVNAGAELGTACIVNTGAIVEHDCLIGDNVHIAPNATLCGNVRVGAGCLIGSGATVVHGAVIPAGCILGAGAVVHRDLHQAGTYVGSPARLVERMGD